MQNMKLAAARAEGAMAAMLQAEKDAAAAKVVHTMDREAQTDIKMEDFLKYEAAQKMAKAVKKQLKADKRQKHLKKKKRKERKAAERAQLAQEAIIRARGAEAIKMKQEPSPSPEARTGEQAASSSNRLLAPWRDPSARPRRPSKDNVPPWSQPAPQSDPDWPKRSPFDH